MIASALRRNEGRRDSAMQRRRRGNERRRLGDADPAFHNVDASKQ